MGWQPNFTSYIPGHDCPWGPHRLTRPCSAPTPILDRIPHLEDLQASWLMLLYCASPRCTCLLRMCSPNLTTEFANNHNLAVAVSAASSKSKTSKPRRTYHSLSQGGVGLTCASILATPAFWSSWAESLPVIYNQPPQYAGQILEQLQHPAATVPSIQAVAGAAPAMASSCEIWSTIAVYTTLRRR